MFAEERQEAILTQARSEGRVDVDALTHGFNVSAETIRRDLKSLERSGQLRRVHGGAIPSERLTFEPALAQRDQVMTREKEAIAARALEELPETGAILLDSGSTTRRLAQIIPAGRSLTVVTNSPAIGLSLAHRDEITVMLLGGRLRKRTLATVDAGAIEAVGNVHVDVAFIATNGLSVPRGLTTPDTAEASIKRAMIASARRVVVLADHTKIGEDYFARFGDLSAIDLLVTDSGLDDAVTAQLTEAGLAVARADLPLNRRN
ncbi:MAG: DeoR/GlpR family DNA-binding transcription regulator [Nocardioidaceae bacterium]